MQSYTKCTPRIHLRSKTPSQQTTTPTTTCHTSDRRCSSSFMRVYICIKRRVPNCMQRMVMKKHSQMKLYGSAGSTEQQHPPISDCQR